MATLLYALRGALRRFINVPWKRKGSTVKSTKRMAPRSPSSPSLAIRPLANHDTEDIDTEDTGADIQDTDVKDADVEDADVEDMDIENMQVEDLVETWKTPMYAAAEPVVSPAYEACHRVLSVTELLENILMHVRYKELLVAAPLVCKQWHATISVSMQLQCALFFRRLPGMHENVICKNPFLKQLTGRLSSGYDPRHPTWGGVDYHKRQEKKHSEMRRPEASWRRMYVSQVPVLSVQYAHRDGGTQNTSGIRIVDLEYDRWPYMSGVSGSRQWHEVKTGNDLIRKAIGLRG